jgi:hypothetical protein
VLLLFNLLSGFQRSDFPPNQFVRSVLLPSFYRRHLRAKYSSASEFRLNISRTAGSGIIAVAGRDLAVERLLASVSEWRKAQLHARFVQFPLPS